MRRELAARVFVALTVCLSACAHREARTLAKASERLGREIRRADLQSVREQVLPGARAQVDLDRVVGEPEPRGSWAKALAKPLEVRPEAMLFIAPDRPVEAVYVEGGWRFAEDPFVRWDQSSPRAALRTLVRASDEQRWDVILELAPRRYRIGLSAKDLKDAWTDGEQAQALQSRRDRLRDRLADPIRGDSHEAALDVGEGQVVRLEREGSRWVIVDF
ncbi:MAG: hypothetical protein R3A79_09620 [Nannocystaceae bacterium]